MKLAEALHLRADLQKRISQLAERLNNNAKVQEGDSPAEDPAFLLSQLEESTDALAALIAAINKTNSTVMADGMTLTDMIAKKDALSLRISILRNFLNEASQKVERYSNKEIRIYSTVDIPKLQDNIDALSKELRQLDVRLQGLNWTVELIGQNL